MKLNLDIVAVIFWFALLALTPATAQVELRGGDRAFDYAFPHATPKTNGRYHVNLKQPIFVDGNGPFKAEVKWQSIFSGYSPGMVGGTAWRSTDTLSYLQSVNAPIVVLARSLFGVEWVSPYHPRFLQVARVELRVKDSSRFLLYENGETRYDNVVTYHFWARKKVSFENMRSILIAGLKRYYGIEFKWEKQVKECLVLATVDSSKYKYKEGIELIARGNPGGQWYNVMIDDIVYDLLARGHYHDSKWPIVNETGYKGKVGLIEVTCQMNDHIALDRELRKFGLSLTLQKREVDVLAITDHEVF